MPHGQLFRVAISNNYHHIIITYPNDARHFDGLALQPRRTVLVVEARTILPQDAFEPSYYTTTVHG